MAGRNGSGVFTVSNPDFVSGTVISSSEMDANFADVATALTQSIAVDGQTTITGNLPMATYRHTGVGNAAARTDYAAAGQVQDSGLVWGGTAGGTANALTLTLTPAITAYATGQRFAFKAGASPSSSSVTIDINSVGAVAIERDDVALSSSSVIEAGKYYEIIYDGTAFQLSQISATPYSETTGTVTASTTQTQAGGTALTTNNVLISTCANKGDSVTLPTAAAGRSVWITNSGAEAAWVWPASGDAINEGTTDARDPVPLWPKESREYRAHDATGFYTPRPAGQHVLLDRVEGITTNGILSGFSADFIEYHISCVGIETEQSASKILMTISDDNQSTFESTGYYVGIHGQSSSGVDNDSSIANGAYFELHTDTGTGTGNNAAFGGHIDLFDPQRVLATNGHHTWTSYFAGKQSLGTFNAQLGAGGWASTNAITDVKIHTTTGNITKGNVYLYGIVK
jgi:hypothetical protein